MQIIAHRGSHRYHVENTLGAFAAAIADGADGVELDVRTCASGEVVVHHDAHLGRLAGRAAFISAMPWRRLRSVGLGGDETIPALDDVLDLVLGAGLEVHVEVKSDVPDRARDRAAVHRLIARRRRADRAGIVLSSFDPRMLTGARGVRTALAFWRRVPSALGLAALIGADGVHPNHTLTRPKWVAAVRRGGRFVNAWTTDDPVEIRRLRDIGVTGLITDDVPRAIRVLQISAETPISGG